MVAIIEARYVSHSNSTYACGFVADHDAPSSSSSSSSSSDTRVVKEVRREVKARYQRQQPSCDHAAVAKHDRNIPRKTGVTMPSQGL
eukprot:COSAG01_NODE_4729_length_4787_cov_6.511305_4_plen_87_part_00